jgi:threonine aldolase
MSQHHESGRGDIDLRSDLLVRPSQAMIERMVEALAEAPSFELREDERQRRLEARIAELTGHEDALLFPTCTMANQAALAVLTRPGEAVLTQQDAHVLTSEGGAASAISGLHIETVPGDAARPALELWTSLALSSRSGTRPRITAFVLENTHNRSGGRVLPSAYLSGVLSAARRLGLRTHLDGARLFNAAVALDCALGDLAGGFDTVALSLNKGLGAPFGAALAGSAALIESALAWRQRLGGGMRRYGPIAAAAELALADFGHLADDHRRARRLASRLAELDLCSLGGQQVETNIVILDVRGGEDAAQRLSAALLAQGVRVLALDTDRIRMTTYRGISDEDVDRVADAFRGARASLS